MFKRLVLLGALLPSIAFAQALTITGPPATVASTANAIVLRDANQNIFVNNLSAKGTNVTSAGATTTLTVASTRLQTLVGSMAQTFQLPDATTLSVGSLYEFNNNSSGNLSVVNASSDAIYTVLPGARAQIQAIAVSTAAGAWDAHAYVPSNSSWGTAGLSTTAGTFSGTVAGVTGTFTGQLQGLGTATNNNATAGQIGEFVTASLAAGSATSVSNGVPTDIISIALTAGDWEVGGTICIDASGSTALSNQVVWVNTTSATMPSMPTTGYFQLQSTLPVVVGAIQSCFYSGIERFSLAAPGTAYLTERLEFTAGTGVAVYGKISARRIR